MDVEKKRQQEQETVAEIIAIYCRAHHGRREGLCPQCESLARYAEARIAACPRMAVKSFCSVCPVHCYAPARRQEIQAVMRYGGPRMLLHHPLMTLAPVEPQCEGEVSRGKMYGIMVSLQVIL